MAYVTPNFKTKRELREAVAAKQPVRVFEPGLYYGGRQTITEGEHSVEGPHAPKPHTWYAEVQVENGLVVKVR